MITVYLNLPGNAAEAVEFYTRIFEAPEPYIMRMNDIPEEDKDNVPEGGLGLLAYANVVTFAGDLMLSDAMPGETATPTNAVYVCLSHKDFDLLKRTFDALHREGGEVEMPLEPTFFSKLYGIVKDKYGFRWMIMADEY